MNKKLLALLLCLTLLLSMLAVTGLAESMKIKFGDEGPQVRQAQVRLTQLGFYGGETDAKFGYSTFLAVKRFQGMNSLTVDGIIGQNTVIRLYSDSAISKSGAVSPTPFAIRLSYGSQGPAVARVQGYLRSLGYYTAPLEGSFGYSTFLAVKDFQNINGLTVDGVVGYQTWGLLQSGTALPKPFVPPVAPTPTPAPTPAPTTVTSIRVEYGNQNPMVTQLQTRLAALGYAAGPADGSFGYTTYLAVRSFQHKNALKVDGVVGPDTWNRLFSAAAIGQAAATPPPGATPTPVPAPTATPPLRLQYGDETGLVLPLQQRLNALGYNAGAEDGKFGYATYLAVRRFQNINSLTIDGVVGPIAWAALMSPAALPNP